MRQACVEKIRIFMFVSEPRRESEACLAVQGIIVGRSCDKGIHHPPGEFERVMLKWSMQHHLPGRTVFPKGLVLFLKTGFSNEGLLENRHVIKGIRSAVDQSVRLPREQPQQFSLGKLVSVLPDNVGDASTGNDVHLEFRVVVCCQPRHTLSGIGQKDKSSVAFSESQVFEHDIKI